MKLCTDVDMDGVVNFSEFEMDQHKKTLYCGDQDQESLSWDLFQISDGKISLQDFVNKHQNSPQGSVEDFWSKTQEGNVTFEYIENQKILDGLLRMENNPIQWNLDTENFLSDKLMGNVEGINEATFYAGSKYAMFPFHSEDSNLKSVNVHLGGAPKVSTIPFYFILFNLVCFLRFGWEPARLTRLKLMISF